MVAGRVAQLFGMVMICLISFTGSAAQTGGPPANSRGRDFAESQTAYGVDLSEPSLLAALGNENSKVRVLAAHQLAASHYSDAIPAIELAYSEEKDPMARVGIATALSSLHDSRGGEHLQAMCADTTLPIMIIVVIRVVQMLQVLQISAGVCVDTLLDSLAKPSDSDYDATAVSVLPTVYRRASTWQSGRIVKVVQNLLIDKNQQPSVRLAAGDALAEIGLPSSAQVVRRALAQESDPVVRSSLKSDLDVLEKKR